MSSLDWVNLGGKSTERVVPVMIGEAIKVEPGDTLVVALHGSTTPERIGSLLEALRKALPGVEVLILDSVAGLASGKQVPDQPEATPHG